MQGSLHCGSEAVGTTVVPPAHPGLSLLPPLASRRFFPPSLRFLVWPTGAAASAGRIPSTRTRSSALPYWDSSGAPDGTGGAIAGAFTVTDGKRGTMEDHVDACKTYGAGGWIPAGDSRSHQGSQVIRGLRYDVKYLSWRWRVDSCRR